MNLEELMASTPPMQQHALIKGFQAGAASRTEMLKLWENPMLSLADRLAAASGEIDRLCDVIEKAGTTSEIALRIKTEEHQCCTEDLMEVRRSEQEGWKEAAIAWEVCASIHETWAKKKDALYSTRHADFEKHAEHARQKLTPNG
jgi:hypothetical protein